MNYPARILAPVSAPMSYAPSYGSIYKYEYQPLSIPPADYPLDDDILENFGSQTRRMIPMITAARYLSNQREFHSEYVNNPSFPFFSQGQQAKCRQLPCRTWISTGSCPYGDRCVFLHDPRVASKAVPTKGRKKSSEDLCQDSYFWPTMTRESVNGKLDNRNRKININLYLHLLTNARMTVPHVSQHYIVPHPSSVSRESDLGVLDSPASLPPPHQQQTLGQQTPSLGYDPLKDPRHVAGVYCRFPPISFVLSLTRMAAMWNHFLDFCASDELSIVREPRLVPTKDPTNPFNPHTGGPRLPVFMDLAQGRSIALSSSDPTSL